MATNFWLLLVFCAVPGAFAGWWVRDVAGALIGGVFGICVGIGTLSEIYNDVKSSNLEISTDENGIALKYPGVEKRLLWTDISSVRLTRSIFWRNLLHINGPQVRIILNFNIQPQRQDLISILAEKIESRKLENFGWEGFKQVCL